MKKIVFLFPVLFLLSVSRFGSAQISKKTFASGEAVTAGKLFLDQVDKVSLYLSTDRIVYTPSLEKEMHLNMTITLLEVNYQPRSEVFREFVSRHIETFNKTLKKRLEFYTPELAKEFNVERDASFLIQVGADRKKVAAVQQGKWEWLDRVSLAAPKQGVRVVERPWPKSKPALSECKKKCPALIQKKPKEKTLPL